MVVVSHLQSRLEGASEKETSGCRLAPPVSLGSGLGTPGRAHGVSSCGRAAGWERGTCACAKDGFFLSSVHRGRVMGSFEPGR